MRALQVSLLFFAMAVIPLAAQEEPRLWMPEGYRILSVEEHQALPPEELQKIGSRNQAILSETIERMTPREREAVALELQSSAQGRELTQVEKQYVTRVSMMLLAAGIQEHQKQEDKARDERFQKLLIDQEQTTRGFPGDQASVQKEVQRIEPLLGREDPYKVYLMALKPLRARPWNKNVRFLVRRILRGNSQSYRGAPTLLDAALKFVQARRAESPSEGAWDSLEAYLRLSMRGEVAEARKLFGIAVSKNAQDLESRVFPLLFAEIDQNPEDIARLMPRAREAWPRQEDLDRVLLDWIFDLPPELKQKARQTYAVKYKKSHPTDWDARLAFLEDQLKDKAFREVENETSAILVLPATMLPLRDRLATRSLNLRARADQGRCTEVEPELTSFAAEIRVVEPFDPDASPRPRTAAEVLELRKALEESSKLQTKLETFLKTGRGADIAELQDVPVAERRAAAEEALKYLNSELAEMKGLFNTGDDLAVAAEWSRRELLEWETGHNVSRETSAYDLSSGTERLMISLRSDLGECFLQKGDPDSAIRVLKPCMGSGRNVHHACATPLAQAGVALARSGNVRAAISVYDSLPDTVMERARLETAILEADPEWRPRTPTPTAH